MHTASGHKRCLVVPGAQLYIKCYPKGPTKVNPLIHPTSKELEDIIQI